MTDGILITTKKTEMKKNNLIWGLGLLMGIFAGLFGWCRYDRY